MDLAVGIPVEARELDLGVVKVAVREADWDGVRRHVGVGSAAGIQDFGDGIPMCGRTRSCSLGLRNSSRSETIGGPKQRVCEAEGDFKRKKRVARARGAGLSLRFLGFTQVGVVASVRYTCTRTDTVVNPSRHGKISIK